MRTHWKRALASALTLCAFTAGPGFLLTVGPGFLLTAAPVFLLTADPVFAQDDRLAGCPDPAAAQKYVKQCLQENPYNTREVCEERALEKLCSKK